MPWPWTRPANAHLHPVCDTVNRQPNQSVLHCVTRHVCPGAGRSRHDPSFTAFEQVVVHRWLPPSPAFAEQPAGRTRRRSPGLHRDDAERSAVQRWSLQGKPAVLWFWTPWCPFCNAEAPSVSSVAAANPKVTFVGVAARSDNAAMSGFVSKYNLNFTNLNDADGSIWARYNVPWQPAYVFYRSDGTSTFVNNPTSAMPQQELQERVSALTA